jgi:pimeloyl-[acyl-carrier protein] methyl ester esterase
LAACDGAGDARALRRRAARRVPGDAVALPDVAGQGSDEGRRTLAELRERLFARGDPDPRQLDAALSVLRDADLRPSLPGVRAPALVIGGARDALVPLAATKALAAALPNAAHRTIDGAAHAPFLSHPAAFAAALESVRDD